MLREEKQDTVRDGSFESPVPDCKEASSWSRTGLSIAAQAEPLSVWVHARRFRFGRERMSIILKKTLDSGRVQTPYGSACFFLLVRILILKPGGRGGLWWRGGAVVTRKYCWRSPLVFKKKIFFLTSISYHISWWPSLFGLLEYFLHKTLYISYETCVYDDNDEWRYFFFVSSL